MHTKNRRNEDIMLCHKKFPSFTRVPDSENVLAIIRDSTQQATANCTISDLRRLLFFNNTTIGNSRLLKIARNKTNNTFSPAAHVFIKKKKLISTEFLSVLSFPR
jgi:hypothetical protein